MADKKSVKQGIWKPDPLGRPDVEKVTKTLELPVWTGGTKGDFRKFWEELWSKLDVFAADKNTQIGGLGDDKQDKVDSGIEGYAGVVTNAINGKLNKSGGTMTGPLKLVTYSQLLGASAGKTEFHIKNDTGEKLLGTFGAYGGESGNVSFGKFGGAGVSFFGDRAVFEKSVVAAGGIKIPGYLNDNGHGSSSLKIGANTNGGGFNWRIGVSPSAENNGTLSFYLFDGETGLNKYASISATGVFNSYGHIKTTGDITAKKRIISEGDNQSSWNGANASFQSINAGHGDGGNLTKLVDGLFIPSPTGEFIRYGMGAIEGNMILYTTGYNNLQPTAMWKLNPFDGSFTSGGKIVSNSAISALPFGGSYFQANTSNSGGFVVRDFKYGITTPGASIYSKMISHTTSHSSYGYNTRASIGVLRTSAAEYGQFIINLEGDGTGTNQKNWIFDHRNGNFSSPGNIAAASDKKLKKNLKVIPNAIKKIKAVNGYTYERIDTGEKQTGVVAQEIQKILPQAVTETIDISGEKTLGVAYGNLVGLLIEGIKEQQNKIDSLEERIMKLEKKEVI